MSDLPTGWEWTTVGEVTLPVSKVDPRANPEAEFRYIDIGGVDGDRGTIQETQRLTGGTAPSRARQLVRAGDTVLSTVRTYMRKTALVPEELDGQVASTGFCVLRPGKGLHPRYLYHAVRRQEFVDALSAMQTGSSYPAVRDRDVWSMLLPLAPVDEQERIVAAVEEHFSRLDAAEASLKSAVLRLAQMTGKIKEAILADASQVPLAELAVEARYGTSVKCRYIAPGPGVIRIPNIIEEHVEVGDLKYATDTSALSPDLLLREGDLLFVRTNGSRDLIGRAAIASGEAEGFGFASYLIRYRLHEHVEPRYVCAVMSSPSVRRMLEGLAATTAGQYNLSISKLDSVTIPVPPLDQQRRLLQVRTDRLAGVARLKRDISVAQRRTASLRRSVGASALSGRLVPQDPTAEPASVLLARIRAERAAAAPAKHKRKSRRS